MVLDVVVSSSDVLKHPDGTRRGSGMLRDSDRPEIVLYDFRRPTKLARDHIRILQMSFETFARRLGTLLTSSLRAVSQVNLLAIDQQTYEEYISALESPTILAPMGIKPLAGTGVFEFSVTSALACIDHLLGGPGGPQATRALTDIETSLMRGLMDQVAAVLRYALEPISPIEPELGPLEFNPQFLQAAGSTDTMIVCSFELRVGSEVGLATLALPFASIFPKLQTKRSQRPMSASEQLTAQQSARQLREGLGDVPVDVSVRFDTVQLSPAQIMELQPGDVVPLPHRVSAPLSVQCGAITFTHAVAGREGSRLAGLVVNAPREKSK
jgi:flagellar motor switch protein FliM